MLKHLLLISLCPAISPLFAQADLSLLSASYLAPAIIEVVPGQIVTLFARGIKPGPNGFLRNAQAAQTPLPETLAGLGAQVIQTPNPQPFRVPILAVRQQHDCEEITFRPICILTAIRVQIPTELSPTVAKIVIEEDGQLSRTFLIRPIRDNAHIITTCDLTWDTNPAAECRRLIYHADSKLVDDKSPAHRGETLTMYAHGFGPTAPRVPSGETAPIGVILPEASLRTIKVGFIFLRNAAPALPRYFKSDSATMPNALEFIGLTPGQVGLYQLNVRVPESLEVPIPCSAETRTNMVVKVSTSQGVENVALCVEP